MFEVSGASGWNALFTEMFQREAFFLAVSKILYQLGLGSVFLFLIYSATSVSVKFYLINEHSKDKWLSLAFFASYFFILFLGTVIPGLVLKGCFLLLVLIVFTVIAWSVILNTDERSMIRSYLKAIPIFNV